METIGTLALHHMHGTWTSLSCLIKLSLFEAKEQPR